MASNFIAMCYAVAKKAGVDTSKMTPDEVVEWYNKQQRTNEAKGKATEIVKDYVVKTESKEKVKEIRTLINTLKDIKKVKTKELVNYISSLKPINLKIKDDEIIAEFDKFSGKKNVYGHGRSDTEGYNFKINNIEDLLKMIENSKYTYSKAETGKNTPQHKGVKEWHYFVNEIETEQGNFDLTVNVRDKGDHKFVYEVAFKKKKT